MQIVTLTMNPAIDVNTQVQHVVAERKLRCGPARHEPGGGGINVSRAIRKLGGQSLAIYPCGGWTGRMLENLLSAEELDQQVLPVQEACRQNFTVMEKSTSRLYRFVSPGPRLSQAEWRKCLEAVERLEGKVKYVVASGSLPVGVPEDFYRQLASRLKGRRVQVIVDTKGEALRQAAAEGVFLLKPNIDELRQLAGRELTDEVAQEKAARQLIELGKSEVVLVSLGAGGLLLVTKDGSERVAAPPVPIRSRAGAGDSMVAGVVLGLSRDYTLAQAVRFGVAAGSAAVMTPGTELCRRQDAERLYEQMRP